MGFTERDLKRIKITGKPQTITETGVPPDMRGLQLFVTPTGSKVWRFRFKIDGATRYLPIGSYPAVSLADAHRKVQEHRRSITIGNDPSAARQATISKNKAAPTVQDIFEDFRDHHLRPKRKRPGDAEAIIQNHVLSTWGAVKAKDINRRTIIQHVRGIAEKRGPRIAEVTKGLIILMFNHAVDSGLLDQTPASRLPVVGSRGAQRERTLTDDEVQQFWARLEEAKATPAVRAALRLLLLTGQRRQEVALAQWADIDLDEATWTIPAENSKNGKVHVVPLSDMALDVLDDLAKARRRKHKDGTETVSAYLVPSTRIADQPVEPLAITRVLARGRDHFAMPAFTVHDLRRTCASGLAALGVSRFVVARVLNHSDDSVTARYDRHDYLEEKRDALNKWAVHVKAAIEGTIQKVTPIDQAKQRRSAGK
jgi:integrase